jgi:hypothetical protein
MQDQAITGRHSLPASDGVYRRRYDWADVARHYELHVTGQAEPPAGSTLADLMSELRGKRVRQFYGRQPKQVLRDLREGRDFPASAYANLPAEYEGEGPAWRFNDEDGDYQHDLLLSGEPNFYLDRRQEPARLGLHVHAEISFVWSTDTETIGQYGAWVGGALRGIMDQGYDVALAVTCNLDGTIAGENGRHEWIIQVTHFGELLQPKDYAVLFSPEGFRQIMFAMMSIPECREGKRTSGSYGTVITGQGWGADWDQDDRVLRLTCNSMGGAFPADDMNQALTDLMPGF